MTLLTQTKNRVGINPATRDILDTLEASVVKCLRASVDYTMTAATVLLTLPAGAVVVGITADITTLFNDSGTDTLDFGVPGTAQQWRATGIAAGTAGQTLTGWQNLGILSTSTTAPTVVTATYTGQNSDATAGVGTVTFFFVQPS